MNNQQEIDALYADAFRLVYGGDSCYASPINSKRMDLLTEPSGFIAKGVMRYEDVSRLVSLQDDPQVKLNILYYYRARLIGLLEQGKDVSEYITAVSSRIQRISTHLTPNSKG